MGRAEGASARTLGRQGSGSIPHDEACHPVQAASEADAASPWEHRWSAREMLYGPPGGSP